MKAETSLLLAIPATFSLAVAGAAQGLPPIQHTFSDGSTLRLYGQVDKGVLNYDDGIDTETYAVIDNNNSNTRLGLQYDRTFGGWAFENLNEFQYAPFSTANINILDQTPPPGAREFTNANIRKIDFTLTHKRYGKVWIGQGSMSTDGIAELDLSGTSVIAYSSVGDSATAQIIRFSDPALADDFTGPRIGDAFSNYDGPRRVRIRYDTPVYNGLSAAFAYGRDLLSDEQDVRDQDLFDAAVRYRKAFATVEFEAGVGYFRDQDASTVWSGSATALHAPTGLNFTLAAGTQDNVGGTGTYWYGKLGLLRHVVPWGTSAAAIDYYSGNDIFLAEDDGITRSGSDSLGLSLVQAIERANTDIWLTYRSYDYSDDLASYAEGHAIFGGARFRF